MPPRITDFRGSPLDDILANSQVFVSSTVSNNLDRIQPYILLLDIRNSEGTSVDIAWHSSILSPNENTTVRFPWVIPALGFYEARIFVVSNLENPQVISGVYNSSVQVLSRDSRNDSVVLADNYNLVARWGGSAGSRPDFDTGAFNLPESIAIDYNGFVYVADETSIQKFSSVDGSFVKRWGSYCDIYTEEGCVDPDGDGPFRLGDGQFIRPHIAVDSSGNIYALEDTGRLQKFSSDGKLLQTLDVVMNGKAIAVDDAGFIYIGDTAQNMVFKYYGNGNLVTSWGSSCILEAHRNGAYGDDPCVDPDGPFGPLEVADGQFDGIWSIATDSTGHVYVVDLGNHRVQKFTGEGKFVLKWDNYFERPIGIALSNDGYAYVADFYDHNIQKFTENGTFITKWGSYCAIATSESCTDPDGNAGPLEVGDGQFGNPSAVALGSDGYVYVVERSNERVQKFDPEGSFIMKWGKVRSFDGLLSFPEAISVDNNGNVYVTGEDLGRVQKFSSSGRFLTKWGNQGSGDGELNFPTAITASTEDGDFVYVADTQNNRIQKFSTDGDLISVWNSFDFGEEGLFSSPSSIATDSSGDVYVFDAQSRVIKVNSEGELVKTWGSLCTLYGYTLGGGYQLSAEVVPAGTGCVDPDGDGPKHKGDGQFLFGADIAVDGKGGYLYATDSGNKRTQKFNLDGQLVSKFDWYGSSIATDSKGNLFIADLSSKHIKKFDENGSLLSEMAIPSDIMLEAITVDENGSLYVLAGDFVEKYLPTD